MSDEPIEHEPPAYLTKSMVFSYDFCPMQFYKNYILKIKLPPTQAMLVGTRFHEYAHNFHLHFDEIPYYLWHETIPHEFNNLEQQMAINFLCHEDERYEKLDLELFKPFACEWWGQSETLKIRGYIDRIDWLNIEEHEVMLVEYKTSGSFDDRKLRQELAFYSILFNDITENQYTIKKTACYNPKLNIYQEWDLHKRDITNATKKWDKLKDAIAKNKFEYKCNEFKNTFCKYCTPEETGIFK